MDRRFLIILAALIIGMGAYIVFSKKSDTAQNNGSGEVGATNRTYGEGKKKVTLIEYGDFQCPACAQYYPILKQLKEQYKEDITFQFRNFPLENIHPNARAAHRAAEAASKQNKFWEMHDKLYEGQQGWTGLTAVQSVFEGYAKELGLDVEKYKQDYASEETNKRINADIAAGKELDAASTPTFILNGTKIDNPRGLDELEKLIKDEIAKQNPQPAGTASPAPATP